MQAKQQRNLVRTSTGSVSRVARERVELAGVMDSGQVKCSMDQVVKPKSLAQGVKKVGVVLCASPDPFTGIPGAALIAASCFMKSREPASLEHLARETRKMMRDIESLSL